MQVVEVSAEEKKQKTPNPGLRRYLVLPAGGSPYFLERAGYSITLDDILSVVCPGTKSQGAGGSDPSKIPWGILPGELFHSCLDTKQLKEGDDWCVFVNAKSVLSNQHSDQGVKGDALIGVLTNSEAITGIPRGVLGKAEAWLYMKNHEDEKNRIAANAAAKKPKTKTPMALNQASSTPQSKRKLKLFN